MHVRVCMCVCMCKREREIAEKERESWEVGEEKERHGTIMPRLKQEDHKFKTCLDNLMRPLSRNKIMEKGYGCDSVVECLLAFIPSSLAPLMLHT